MNKNSLAKSIIFVCAFIFIAQLGLAQKTSDTIKLDKFLTLGPLSFAEPAFADVKDINGKEYNIDYVFSYPYFDLNKLELKEGESFKWQSRAFNWTTITPSVSNIDEKIFAWVLSAFYLRTEAYGTVELKVNYAPAFELYVDGVKKHSRHTSINDTAEIKSAVVKLEGLEPGFHKVVIKALYNDSAAVRTNLSVDIIDFETKARASYYMQEFYGMDDYLYGAGVSSPKLSADGKYYILHYRKGNQQKKKADSWAEMHKVSDNSIVKRFEGISNLVFAPNSEKYAYIKRSGKYVQIYVGENAKEADLVYETTDKLSGFKWGYNGDFMILSFTTKGDKPKHGLKSLSSPMDHWSYYRDRTNLQKLNLADLDNVSLQPITYGDLSTKLFDISRDGEKIIFSTSEGCDTIRQYIMNKIYLMDLKTNEYKLLFSTTFSVYSVNFIPNTDKLLVSGSEIMFEDVNKPGVGFACDTCFIYNDYNTKAFIYDINTKKAELIGKDFAPSINSMTIDRSGRYVYIQADEKDEVSIFSYDLEEGKFSRIPLKVETASGFSISANYMLYVGTGANKPFKAFLIEGDAAKNGFVKGAKNAVKVSSPQAEDLKEVLIAEYKDWSYQTRYGDSIDATFYLPPDFNESEKYPCIVYYYAGTAPTPKALSYRYCKSLWASMGYVVLVLQPSGTIGYGSEFASRHVNNWGETVIDEIIDGTQSFYRTHSFVDSTKLGCIGASYGGFTTQLLITKTDIYAAAISHAGISSLSSYWGEGYWGYLYSATATAFSFPWNRRDLYVDQSPLFNADKIHTPLLLTHGTADNNVPVGESYQMYKALRLLGRTVAMVTVDGENHGIVGFEKRLEWEKTILAWFERFLKDKPEWWDAMYKDIR